MDKKNKKKSSEKEVFPFEKKDLVKIIIIIVISTFLTMGITGKVVQMMIDYREKKGLK